MQTQRIFFLKLFTKSQRKKFKNTNLHEKKMKNKNQFRKMKKKIKKNIYKPKF